VVTRWHLGERDSARELLQEALKQSPDNRHLKEAGEQLRE
jgi:hypothetical protein